MMWVRKSSLKKPALNRCERYFSCNFSLLGGYLSSMINHCRQLGNSWVKENLFWGELETCPSGSAYQLNTENRVAAELKEIVVDTNSLTTQQLLPYFYQAFFN